MADTIRNETEDQHVALYSPQSDELGSILINPDVIARIAAMAVTEVEGVAMGRDASLAERARQHILPGRHESIRGVEVTQAEGTDRYRLVCEVKMAYQTPMRETAEKVQRHVRDTVQRMAGLELESVDIRIVDIYVEVQRGQSEESAEP